MSVSKFTSIQKELNNVFFEREAEVKGILIATLAKTNILLLGESGTAKSHLVNQLTKHISDSRMFSILLTKYTLPEELQGTPKLSQLKKDIIERPVEGTVNDAHFVFFDETFKGSSAILNAQLELANERTFTNAGKKHKSPVLTLVGASNEIPESGEGLEAFHDRFLLSYYVKYIQEPTSQLAMMRAAAERDKAGDSIQITTISLKEIEQAQKDILDIDLPDSILHLVIKVVNTLRESHGIKISDRTLATIPRILQASAFLGSKSEVVSGDLEILKQILWKDPEDIKHVSTEVNKVASSFISTIEKYEEQVEDLKKNINRVKNDDSIASEDKSLSLVEWVRNLQKVRQNLEKKGETLKDGTMDKRYVEKVLTNIKNFIENANILGD